MSIIGAEDEEFENDLPDPKEQQCSHFNDIDLLKKRPAHLLAFIQHVVDQFDAVPLLCYLRVELLRNLNSKDTKKQFGEFCSLFLEKNSTFRVSVPTHIAIELDRTRSDMINEETLKSFAQEIQKMQALEIAKQLDDFRQKRMMGLTSYENELLDVDSHHPNIRVSTEMKEMSVAENILERMSYMDQAIHSEVVAYMKHIGLKNKGVDNKKSKNPLSWMSKFQRTKDEPKPKPPSIRHEPKPDNEDKQITIPASNFKPVEVPVPSPDSDLPSPSIISPEPAPVVDPAPPKPSQDSEASIEIPDGRKVTRSESARVDRHSRRRGSSRAKQSRSRSDVDLQPPSAVTPPTPLSPQHLRPSVNPEVSEPPPMSPSPQVEEIDPRFQEFEQDPQNWRELAPPDAVKKLSKKEMKRQEIINELFATEHAHVRMLSVLQTVFCKPLQREALLTFNEIETIFPSLDEIIDMHYTLYENLKKLRVDNNYIVKSISQTLLNRFDGTEGEWFQKLTARFCSYQTWALNQIKSRQKSDARFNSFIQEAESKPQCRRLQLKDIIPTEMQRLTKYPLLLQNIAKNTENQTEKEGVEKSADCCRKILNHVNEEVKKLLNMLNLKEYQKKLDTSGLKACADLYTEYKNIDLTLNRTMLYEGPLIWKVTKEKAVEVQCVLLNDLLVLLQKQDDKMVLKCQNKSTATTAEGKTMLSPIIKLDTVFLRDVATDRKAFYVIFTWESGAQIYELVAQTTGEMKAWMEVIKSAINEWQGATMRLSVPVTGTPLISPTTAGPLNPMENGSVKSDERKDMTNEKSLSHRQRLMDFLSDRGFDLITYTSSDQEKIASSALEEAMSLKRQLIVSISLSEDSLPGEESEAERSEGAERSSAAEDDDATDSGYMQMNPNNGKKEGAEANVVEEGNISAPLVLSQERMEEVHRKLQSLEEKLKRLQTVEEQYHKLKEALSEFYLEGGDSQ